MASRHCLSTLSTVFPTVACCFDKATFRQRQAISRAAHSRRQTGDMSEWEEWRKGILGRRVEEGCLRKGVVTGGS